MKTIVRLKRNLLRNLIGVFSFSTALFVFQACYGTPQDFGQDILIEGKVISKSTGSPIEGIQISVADNTQTVSSDRNGNFSFYTSTADSYKLIFTDLDPAKNGSFASTDTILSTIKEKTFITIQLQEK